MISIRIMFFAFFISRFTFCLFAQEIIVPVSEKNRFGCSSFLKPSKVSSYGPENICDLDQTTAWVEGLKGDGVGEWVAIYLGEIEDLKDISELEITIYPGYQKNNDTFENNSVPTRLKFELNLVDQVASSEIMFEPKDKYELRGARKITLKTTSTQPKQGSVWLKITILKVQKGKKWDDTAISEIVCNFKNANPFNIHSIINQFQNALNNRKESQIKLMSKLNVNKIYSAFTNQYEEELNPFCCLAKPEIHSFDTVLQYATGGEVANTYAIFRYENDQWILKQIVSLTFMF